MDFPRLAFFVQHVEERGQEVKMHGGGRRLLEPRALVEHFREIAEPFDHPRTGEYEGLAGCT